jgi:hypothetical protein
VTSGGAKVAGWGVSSGGGGAMGGGRALACLSVTCTSGCIIRVSGGWTMKPHTIST